MNETSATRVIVGYDGLPPASAAIEVGARLIPQAHAWIAHLWTPPFASEELRRRLWRGTGALNEFIEAIEREGAWEADQLAGMGVTLARAAGWEAEPLVQRSYGGEGLEFTQLAEKLDPDLVLIGSRGLGGAKAVLGSVSDMVVHYTPRPVLVTPYPLLMAEHAAVADGPVVLGWDGSAGAEAALAAAARLFRDRELVLASVDDGVTTSTEAGGRELVALYVAEGHGESARAVAEALSAFARQRRAALLVMGSRGRSAVQEIVLGSVAISTLHHAHRPVMVVPRTASPRAH
jgi:nucleotide-binding universal stress UspA family protein